ncbi:MAG: prepilin-type N-terminal cleavage/methylation domain-containing protein [Candidatus Omnitrophica bacterium]|nr:prepilin-type N-terminal cleavage/methylation domain-containing protein [Candidatus Omnitrophota bacterium]
MFKKKKINLDANGFTLIEIMISITLLTVVLLGLISGYMNCLRLNEMSKSTTVATEDARRVLEQMRSDAITTLSDITSVDWTAWAGANGLNSLGSEQIAVGYIDRDGTGDALDDDPLEVAIVVSWQDGERLRNLILSSLITVR